MPIQNTNILLTNNQEPVIQYVPVRSRLFYYLEFINDERDLFSSSLEFSSKPDLLFYEQNSQKKVMLDYTNASKKDKNFLKIFCSNLNQTSGLSLVNASYLDEKNNIEETFNLNLIFSSFNNNILFCTTPDTIEEKYLRKILNGNYFIGVPYITTSTLWENKSITTNSLLICNNPNNYNNFNNISIHTGDILEIKNQDSLNNNSKFEVIEYFTLNDKDILRLKGIATNESLLGSPTIINFYIKSNKKENTNNLDNTQTGCCFDTTSGIYYDKTTDYECYLRSNNNYYFSPNQNCNQFKNSLSEQNISITANSNILNFETLKYRIFTKPIEELLISISGTSILINGFFYSNFMLETNKIYKFIQKDNSNLGYPLHFVTNSELNSSELLYYGKIYGQMYPEGIGSEIIIDPAEQPTSINLYLSTRKNVQLQSPEFKILV